MANIKSALKQWRQNLKRRARNRPARRVVRTLITKVVVTARAGASEDLELSVKQAIQALDKAAGKNIIHANKAARTKSRLMKRLNTAHVAAS